MKRHPINDENDERWDAGRDDRPPAKLERRRHRDPEETDERREAERRLHPRQRGRHSRGEMPDGG